MSRTLITSLALIALIALASATARAGTSHPEVTEKIVADLEAKEKQAAEEALPDQAVAAALGIASGGRTTPGGLRVTGHYLYQLSSRDWFDGTAVFTFGSSQGGCFRDRTDEVLCDHGLADGTGLEISAGVRRMFTAQGRYRPFARIAIGLAVMRFGDDDVTGAGLPIHVGGGIRAHVSKALAIVASGELLLGFSGFNRGLGLEPQFGLGITAGAEFRL